MGGGNGKEEVGLRPTTRWGHLLFLLGRNGHDGSSSASPDPLLLAPQTPSSLAHPIQDTTQPGQLRRNNHAHLDTTKSE